MPSPVTVVTGGSGLVGRSCIKALTRRGHVCISVDLVRGRHGENVEHLQCDIASERSVRRAERFLRQRYGHIENFIHSPSIRPKGFWSDLVDYDLSVWRRVLDVHVTGAMLMARSLVPLMAERRSGSIVFMGSVYGVVAPDFSLYKSELSPAVYTASKAALVGMAKWIAGRYGRQGIRCNVVSPIGIEGTSWPNSTFRRHYLKKIPIGRLVSVDEVVRAVVYVLESSHLNGHNLILDGGWTSV